MNVNQPLKFEVIENPSDIFELKLFPFLFILEFLF